jgi:hypothetical protein
MTVIMRSRMMEWQLPTSAVVMRMFSTCVLLMLAYVFLVSPGVVAAAVPTTLLDMIVFGHPESERAHSLIGPLSVVGSTNVSDLPLEYPQSVTFRSVGADPSHTQNARLTAPLNSFINVTIAVDPTAPTFLTIKLYGSDVYPRTNQGIIHLYWAPTPGGSAADYPGTIDLGGGVLQLGMFYAFPGAAGSGYSELDMSDAENGIRSYPRQFYYSTTLLPAFITEGNSHVNVLIGGWGNTDGYGFGPVVGPLTDPLRPIYRLYTHTDGYFVPLTSPVNASTAKDVEHYEPRTLPVYQPPLPLWSAKQQPIPTSQITANISAMLAAMDQS